MIFRANPTIFQNQYRTTKTYSFSTKELPRFVATCLKYTIPSTGQKETTLQIFGFNEPDKFGSFYATDAEKSKVVSGSINTKCKDLIEDFKVRS